jgi:hypothetical protein
VSYDRETRDDIRRDMLRDCDTSVVGRCRVCGGVTTMHYGQPPECECEPVERESSRRFFRDEDDDDA